MAVAWLLDALTGWLGAALGWLAAGGAVWLMAWRSRGQKAKLDRAKAMEADYENAEDIRRRVSVDRAKRVRELDDTGWRD